MEIIASKLDSLPMGFLSIEWNSIGQGGFTHGIVAKTVHKTLSVGVQSRGGGVLGSSLGVGVYDCWGSWGDRWSRRWQAGLGVQCLRGGKCLEVGVAVKKSLRV